MAAKTLVDFVLQRMDKLARTSGTASLSVPYRGTRQIIARSGDSNRRDKIAEWVRHGISPLAFVTGRTHDEGVLISRQPDGFSCVPWRFRRRRASPRR